jgi:hypothetical protein
MQKFCITAARHVSSPMTFQPKPFGGLRAKQLSEV